MPEQVYTVAEFNSDVVDLSANSTVLSTKTSILRGVHVKTTMTGAACTISDGATAKFTVPALSVAGTWIPFGDAKMGNGIVIDPDDAGAGELTVIWASAP